MLVAIPSSNVWFQQNDGQLHECWLIYDAIMLIIDTTIRAIRELVIAAFPPPVPSLPPQTLHQAASHGREEKHEDRKQPMWCRDASNKIGMLEPTAKLGTITENYTFLFNKPVILDSLGSEMEKILTRI